VGAAFWAIFWASIGVLIAFRVLDVFRILSAFAVLIVFRIIIWVVFKACKVLLTVSKVFSQ
jgi:hypothetical protein